MNQAKIKKLLLQGQIDKAFTKLYKLYPKVEKYVLINSGSKAEALDIFQEGLILLYNKTKTKQDFTLDGFLIKSCKFLWQNELKKKKVRSGNSNQTEKIIQDDSDLQNLIEKENKLIKLEKIIKQISKKCQEIFNLFYFKSMSMTEIAKKFGYKSVQSAKVQKYKCMEQARNLALTSDNIETSVSSSIP